MKNFSSIFNFDFIYNDANAEFDYGLKRFYENSMNVLKDEQSVNKIGEALSSVIVPLLLQFKRYEDIIKECHKEIEKLNASIGRKKKYYKSLDTPEWRNRRNEILELNKHKCMLCGSSDNLQVHHTVYVKGKEPWDYDDSDLVVLCKDCHENVHENCMHELYPKYL